MQNLNQTKHLTKLCYILERNFDNDLICKYFKECLLYSKELRDCVENTYLLKLIA